MNQNETRSEIQNRNRAKRKKKKNMSVGAMIVLDLLAIGVGLCVFALFHHVLDWYGIRLGEKKIEPVRAKMIPLEKEASLRIFDRAWSNHIDMMDKLRSGKF